MSHSLRSYQVYIIRAWDEQSLQSEQKIVRFILKLPPTKTRQGVVSLEALMAALYGEVAALAEPPTSRSNTTA